MIDDTGGSGARTGGVEGAPERELHAPVTVWAQTMSANVANTRRVGLTSDRS